MAITLRPGTTGTLFQSVGSGTSDVFEISDRIGSLTLYIVGDSGASSLSLVLETAATAGYCGTLSAFLVAR